MNIETLRDRIAKAEEKIAKKQNTIAKRTATMAKKAVKLEQLGYAGLTRKQYYEIYETMGDNRDDAYWTMCERDNCDEDIKRLSKEIEEVKATLEKYRAQLAGEVEKDALYIKEIPETMKRMQKELIDEWNRWDTGRRDYLKSEYRKLGYTEFMKKHTVTDYNFKDLTDDQIHKANIRDAEALVIDLYYRVRKITGEVTDWTGIKLNAGNMGAALNGYVIGKEGRAKVESILAGGYNIQRLHVRVLVHEI